MLWTAAIGVYTDLRGHSADAEAHVAECQSFSTHNEAPLGYTAICIARCELRHMLLLLQWVLCKQTKVLGKGPYRYHVNHAQCHCTCNAMFKKQRFCLNKRVQELTVIAPAELC